MSRSPPPPDSSLAGEPTADAGDARPPAPVGLAVVRAPDAPLRHQLPGALHLRREALVHAQHEVGAGPARRLHQRLRIGPAQRQRLLQDHVLARFQRLRRQRHVQVVGHRDVHRVHRVQAQQLVRALQHVRHPEPLAEPRAPLAAGIRHRDQLRLRVLAKVARPAPGHPAGPNDPKPNHAATIPAPRAALTTGPTGWFGPSGACLPHPIQR